MFICRLLMYTQMGWSPAETIASSTSGCAHSLPAPRFAVIPVIRRAARWCNTVRTLSIYLVTPKLLLPYSNTNCATALYISPWARTVAPILSRTLAIISHRLQALRRFSYTAAQSLLLYVIIRPKYGNASNSSKFSALICNDTLLALKQCFGVLRLRRLSSPCLHFSDV